METTTRLRTPAAPGKPAYFTHAPVWLPTASRATASLKIKVKAKSDAHILLSFEGEKKALELVVGGWKNTQTEIRRGSQGMPLASVLHDLSNPPLNEEKFREIHLSWSVEASGVRVKVKVAGKELEVLEKSKKIPVIKAVYVSTGFNYVGEWQVVKEAPESSSESEVENQTPISNRLFQPFRSGPASEPSTPVGSAPAPLCSSLTRQTPLTSLLKRRPQKSYTTTPANNSSAPPTPQEKPRIESTRLENPIFAAINQLD